MASKIQERIHAETAAALLAADWLIEDISEPLDFAVRPPAETFGLEVRQIFVDTETRFGSPSKRYEGMNLRAVSAFAKRYYERGGLPVSAKFLGVISRANSDAVLECMLVSVPAYPGASNTLQAPQVKIFITPLPGSFANYSRWTFVNDMVGWPRRITTSDLQTAINKKTRNLALYKNRYNNIDLLLVADRTYNSGKLVLAGEFRLSNPGFRSIYFMSFPESIQRVG